MKSGFLTLVFVLLFTSTVFGKQSFKPLGTCAGTVDYTYFTLCYEPEHRQASWVKYKLSEQFIDGRQKRTNDYRADENIPDPVLGSDYRGSGYDRGHLLPAADMKLSYRSMTETFYMTNMSPQNPRFNRGIWARIERRIRRLVKQHGTAHVVTGPILEEDLETIDSGVSIPRWYYKVAYFPGPQITKAFLIENKAPEKDVYHSDFLVTVDEVESATGFDFFAELPDHVENKIEAIKFRE